MKLKLCAAALLLLGLTNLTGCTTVGYYSQIVSGHMKIVIGQRPIDEVLADESTDDITRHRLTLAQQARLFAVSELGLPDNDSYSTYYDTGRDFVTWNVIAADEFSLDAKRWCFPVAGCVSYRGYYKHASAERYANGLAEQGMDVAVTGATAYSTLGWFNDPLLNTILKRSDAGIVALIIHELAHQQLYVKDDSTFNESFATFVERTGLSLWLDNNPDVDKDFLARMDQFKKRRVEFLELLQNTRAELADLYQSGQSSEQMRTGKAKIFTQMRDNYQQLKSSWDGYSGYDGWFAKPLNNARLVAVGTYHDYVSAFAALFNSVDRDFERFYAASGDLAELSPSVRLKRIKELQASSN